MHLNLLPHEFRAKLLVRRRLRQWAVVWAASALLTVIGLSLEYRHVAQTRTQTELVEGRCQPTRGIEREAREQEAQAAILSRRLPVTQGVELSGHALGLIGELGRGVQQSEGKLQLVRFDLRTTVEAPKVAAPGKPAAGDGNLPKMHSDVTLHGAARDDAAVARLMQHLREGQRLEGLKLKAYSARPTAEGVVRDYQIEGRM